MGYKRKVTETDELKKMIKDGKKKFVRMDEGAVLYSLGLHTFRQLAADANALYHIKKITLANTEIIDEYMEHFRDEY